MERKNKMQIHKIQKIVEQIHVQDAAVIGGALGTSYAVYMEIIEGTLALGLTAAGLVYTVLKCVEIWRKLKHDSKSE